MTPHTSKLSSSRIGELKAKVIGRLTMFVGERRREDLLALAIAALIAFVYFYRALLGEYTFFSSPDDIVAYYAQYQRLSRSLAVGQLPLWDPGVWSGRSFTGLGQTGVFYPPNLIHVLFFGASEGSLTLLAIFHAIAACFFFYLLSRHLGNDFASSLSAGISFAFIVVIIQWLAGAMDLTFGLIWTPLILLCLYKCLDKWVYSLPGGLFLSMSLLAGHLQTFFNNLLIVGIVTLLLILRIGEPRTKLPAWKILCRVMAIALFALGFSTVHILSVMESFALSYRWVGDPSGPILATAPVSFNVAANSYFLPIPALIDVINPFFYWPLFEGQPYFGLLALVFAIIAVGAFHSRSDRRSLIVFVLIGAVGLVISLGGQTPLYWIFYTLVPFANRLREPGRFIFLFQFASSILAAYGLGRLLHHMGDRKRILAAILLVVILTGEIIAVRDQWGSALVPNAANSSTPSNLYRMNPIISYVEHDYLKYRVLNWQNALPPNIGDVYSIETTSGYAATMNKRYFDFQNINWSPDSIVYDLLNVKYVVSKSAIGLNMTLLLQWGNATCPYTNVPCDLYLYNRPHPMPRFWVPKAVRHVATENESMETVKRFIMDHESPWSLAIVEDGKSGIEQFPLSSRSTVEAIRLEEQFAEIRVNTPGESFLVHSSVFYPGWVAYVDGIEVPIYPAYYALRAIKIPKGDHLVEFVYKPTFVTIGFPVTVAVVFLALLLCYYSNWERKWKRYMTS